MQIILVLPDVDKLYSIFNLLFKQSIQVFYLSCLISSSSSYSARYNY